MIHIQLVPGISDQVILADLLRDEKTDRTTVEVVEFIACKEQAKAERRTVAGDNFSVALSTRKKASCRGCDGPDHGRRAQRITKCPARNVTCGRFSMKGHYTAKCFKCRDCRSWGHSTNKSKYCKATDKSLAKEKQPVTHSNLSLSLNLILFVT